MSHILITIPITGLLRLNPLSPSDAVRQQKKIFQRIFSVQYCLNSKNITPLETLKFYNLGILKSSKLRILVKKTFQFLLS